MSLSGTCPFSTRLCVLYRFLLASCFVWSCTGSALAAVPVLMVVRATDATDPAPYELRLRSELAAEGVDAIVANRNVPSSDARQLAAKFGANAVVEITVAASELTTSVWVADSSLSLEVTRQLRVSNLQRDAVAIFALRSVDLLQGARLELEQQRRAKLAAAAGNQASSPGVANGAAGSANALATATPQTNPDNSVRPAPAKVGVNALGPRVAVPRTSRPTSSRPSEVMDDRFRVELSYALLVPSDKFGWATAPALSLSFRVRPRWMIGLSLFGPFVNHINTSSGQYRIVVDQELLQLELRRVLRLTSAFELEPLLGLGGSRYAADGQVREEPFVGHLATAWSLYLVAGGNLVWHLGSHVQLVTGLSAFGRWQAPQIEVNSQDMSGRARFNWLANVGPAWSF